MGIGLSQRKWRLSRGRRSPPRAHRLALSAARLRQLLASCLLPSCRGGQGPVDRALDKGKADHHLREGPEAAGVEQRLAVPEEFLDGRLRRLFEAVVEAVRVVDRVALGKRLFQRIAERDEGRIGPGDLPAGGSGEGLLAGTAVSARGPRTRAAAAPRRKPPGKPPIPREARRRAPTPRRCRSSSCCSRSPACSSQHPPDG